MRVVVVVVVVVCVCVCLGGRQWRWRRRCVVVETERCIECKGSLEAQFRVCKHHRRQRKQAQDAGRL
jgi:hypothetical protein